MSSQTALQPAVSTSVAYFVPDQDPTSNPPKQYQVALQPNVSEPGNQTIVPGVSPSR